MYMPLRHTSSCLTSYSSTTKPVQPSHDELAAYAFRERQGLENLQLSRTDLRADACLNSSRRDSRYLTAEMKKLPDLSEEECDAAIARVELLKVKLGLKNCHIQLLKAAAFINDNDFKHHVGMHFGKKTKLSVEALDNAQAELQAIAKNLLFGNPTLKAIVTKVDHYIDLHRSEVRIGELETRLRGSENSWRSLIRRRWQSVIVPKGHSEP
jgi:hypothetical protein